MVTGCTKSSVAVFALPESTCVRCRQSILYALSIRACDTRWCIHYEWFTRLMVATARPVTTESAPLDNVHTAPSEVRFNIPVSSYQSHRSIQHFLPRWSISTIIVTFSKTIDLTLHFLFRTTFTSSVCNRYTHRVCKKYLYSIYFYIQNSIVSTEGIRIFLHQKFINREMDYTTSVHLLEDSLCQINWHHWLRGGKRARL